MSTIRPLATIAVLAALGVFLAYEINQGPAVALNDEWSTGTPALEIADEPPAWNGGGEALSAVEAVPEARSAPSWAESGSATPAEAAPPTDSAVPAFPPLPDLPKLDEPTTNPPPVEIPMPVQGQSAGTTLADEGPVAPTFPTATQEALELPDNIPQANYGGTTPPPTGVSGRVPSLGSATPGYQQPGTPATPDGDTSGFEAAWQDAQSALESKQLRRAHSLLTQWHSKDSLSPEQQQRLEGLLSQLAGTVVYSTEHHLEPAHIVTSGETLATIAQKYNVPWQLLAKINGIPSTDAVAPGQSLKVLRGPFNAEVDLKRGELVLMLGDRYAGKFPVRVEGAAPADGPWQVGQKRLENAGSFAATPSEPRVVLQSPAGEQVELSSSPLPSPGTKGRLTVASRDLGDLFDILSVGSTVTVKR